MAADIALGGAHEVGAQTQAIDLRDYTLIFCDGKEDESRYPEGVFRLRKQVKEAHGIILGTPEYHGGYRGARRCRRLSGCAEREGFCPTF